MRQLSFFLNECFRLSSKHHVTRGMDSTCDFKRPYLFRNSCYLRVHALESGLTCTLATPGGHARSLVNFHCVLGIKAVLCFQLHQFHAPAHVPSTCWACVDTRNSSCFSYSDRKGRIVVVGVPCEYDGLTCEMIGCVF